MRTPLGFLNLHAASAAVHAVTITAAGTSDATTATVPSEEQWEAYEGSGAEYSPLLSQWGVRKTAGHVGLNVRAGSRKGAKADQRRAHKSRNRRKSRN